ncbi:MAG: PGF-pre-PGF domain-containing protein [archaeon]
MKKADILFLYFLVLCLLVPVVLAAETNISVVKYPENSTVNCSSNSSMMVQFIINVTNNNDYNLTNITVNDTPLCTNGLSFQTSSPMNTNFSSCDYVSWLINNLGPNESYVIYANFTAYDAGNLTNTVRVSNATQWLLNASGNVIVIGTCSGEMGNLNVNLTFPPDEYTFTSAPFTLNYTVTGSDSANCSLWGNFTGVWAENQTRNNVTIGDINTTNNFTLSSLTDGIYAWNVMCTNGENESWAASNQTFSVDTTPPTVHIVYPANGLNTSNATESFDWNMSDNIQLRNITIFIWNSTGDIAYSDDRSVAGAYNESASSLDLYFEYNFTYSDVYLWNCYGCDDADHCAWSQEGNYSLNYTQLAEAVNLTVVKYMENNTVNCSSMIQFIINVTNNDDYNLTNITINDTLGNTTGFFFWASSPVQTNFSSDNYVYWTISNLGPNESYVIYANFTASSGNLTNTVRVSNATQWLLNASGNVIVIGTCGGEMGNLTVNLTFPSDGYTFTSAPFIFNYTVNGSGMVSNCSLWGNFTGVWAENQTNTNVSNASLGQNNNFTVDSLVDGNYQWNVMCMNGESASFWAGFNRTFSVDTAVNLMSTSIYSDACGFNYVNESGEIIKYGGGEVEILGYVNDSDLKNWSLGIYTNGAFNSTACVNASDVSINGTLCLWNTTQFCPIGAECGNVTLVLSVFDNAGHQNNISDNANRINPIIIDNKYPNINETALYDFVKDNLGRWNVTFNVSDEHLSQASAYILNSSDYIVLQWDTLCNISQNSSCASPGSGTFLQEWDLGSCSLNGFHVPVHYKFNFEPIYGISNESYFNAIPGCIKFNATSEYDCGQEYDSCTYEGEPNCKAYRWWPVYNMSVETGNGTLIGLTQENWCLEGAGCSINTSLINPGETKFRPQMDKYNGQGNFTKENLPEITLYAIGNPSNLELVQDLEEGNYNFLVQAQDYVWTSDSSWENLFAIDLTAPQLHFSWWNTTSVDQNMTETPITIPDYRNFTKQADIFFSPNELTINFSVKASDNIGMNQTWGYGYVYADLSEFENFTKHGTCDGDVFELAYNSSLGKWEGNCTFDLFNQSDILNYTGNGNESNGSFVASFNVRFIAVDTYGNPSAGVYNTSITPPQECEDQGEGPGNTECMPASSPVNLHDLGVPQLGGPRGEQAPPGMECIEIGSLTTNFNDEFDFTNISFIMEIKVNMSCQANNSLLPQDYMTMMLWNFSSLDFSSPSTGQKLGNLMAAVDFDILPPNSHGSSRIYVNSSAFAELNRTTTVTIYHLPFTTMPEIISDLNDATGINISSINWTSNGYEPDFHAITGNLTFSVYGFSGYNVSDNVSPIITPAYPANGQNITITSTINFNFSVNGTGTPISRVQMMLNGTESSYNPDNQPPLYDITCNPQTNGSELYSCNTTSHLSNGEYQAIITAWDYGEEAGNNATYALNFSVQANESEPEMNVTANLTLLNSGRPNVGEMIRLLINITNTGSANISNLTVVDGFDANYNYTNASLAPNGVDYANHTISWNNISVNLSQGQSYTLYANFSALSTAYNAINTLNSTVYYESGSSSANSYSLGFEIGENVTPNIVFIDAASTEEGNYSRSSIWANVTVGDSSAVSSISIFLFNSSGLYNSSMNNTIDPSNTSLFANFTNLPDGAYRLNATANDTWGNMNSTGTRIIILDTAAPTFSNPSNTSADFKRYSDFTANITTTDSLVGLDHYMFFTNATGSWANTSTNISGASNNASNSANITSPRGTNVCWYYWANDTLGNSNNSTIYCFVVADTMPTAPTLDQPLNKTNATIATPFFNWTASTDADSDTVTYGIEIASDAGFVSIAQSNYTLTANNYTATALSDGTYFWRVKAITSYANSTYTGNRTLTIDTIAPTLTVLSPSNTSYFVGQLIRINFSASDLSGISRLWYYNTTANNTFSSESYISLANGSYTFTFYANDSHSHLRSQSISFAVGELEPGQLIANESSFSVPENVSEIILPTNQSISEITIPSDRAGTETITLNLGQRVDSNGNMSFGGEVNISRTGSSVNYSISIPADVIISGGTGWDGEFILPTVKSASGLSAPTISGATTTLEAVIIIGYSGELNFSSPVKLVIGGMAGKKAAWARNSSGFTDILTYCDNESAPTNININSSVRECYTNDSTNTDLIIWTYHFTDFAAYSSTPVVVEDNNNHGGGGGGGSVPASNSTNPQSSKSWNTIPANVIQMMNISNIRLGVYEIKFSLNKAAGVAKITIELLPSKPSDANAAEGGIYKYLKITKAGITDDQIMTPIRISFRVEKSWLTANGISSADVFFKRYSSSKWMDLKTTKVREDSSYAYYESESLGFSYFLIGAKTSLKLTTPAVNPVINISADNTPPAETIVAPEAAKPAEENKTVEPAKEKINGALIGKIVIGVVLVLIVAVFIVLLVNSRKKKPLPLVEYDPGTQQGSQAEEQHHPEHGHHKH